MGESKVRRQYLAALAASSCAFCVGTILGWTSPVQNEITGGAYGFSVSDDEFAWVGSSMTLAAFLICVPIGFIIRLIGRKITMLILVIPTLLGWILLITGDSLVLLIVGRFFGGIAAGSYCVAAPNYIGEIAQKDIRGTLGTFFQFMIVTGILFVYVVGAFLSCKSTTIVCAVPPIIFFIVFIFMPETPAFLVGKEKLEAAEKSIKWLRGNEYNSGEELAELKLTDAAQKQESSSLGSALKRKSSKKAIVIGVGCMIFQQLCGINAVIFYSTDIFMVSKSDIEPSTGTIIIGVVQIIATAISLFVIDRVGRRILLILSAALMAVSTTGLGVFFFMQQHDKDTSSLGWLPVSSMVLFIVMFSLGFGPIPWCIMGEIFSSDIRAAAASIAACVNWGLAFVVTKTFVNLKDFLGNGETFFLFSAISILGVFFVIFLLPETKGKSINEIQDILSGKNTTA